ncbi:MAG: alpha/beta hydrolase fold domain-containing protein [Bacteroidales bacterium]|nr:alpha/beta hydrolase fold domain-containing protein [Bacteroidales bacterium]HOY37784.1 alpha/beta hydrolase fold domain-containing protein [Bacteroidales bacterium]HQP03568.1 alpha/beta hydrolase fold domain-containing protein [Bacteroidales bacterium]
MSQSFENINIERDIVFAIEDGFDFMGFGIDNPEPLRMDVYFPSGDNMKARPLVICLFGGAFLAGSKERPDMIAWCDSLAHYGYVAAAINYRLGFNPLTSGKGFGADEGVIRALYRSTQDCRAAVRYFINQHERYHIDTTCIFLLGNSAGAITAINTAFMTGDERSADTYETGYGANNHDLGCLDCTGGFRKNKCAVAGVVSLWGAALNPEIIDKDEEIPVLFIHGTADEVVPYDKDYALNFTLGKDLNVFLYGSKSLKEHCDKLGWTHTVLDPYLGQPHCFYACGNIIISELNYDTFPCEYWWPVFYQTIRFLGENNKYCDKKYLPSLENTIEFTINDLSEKGSFELIFKGNLLMNNRLTLYNAIGDVVLTQVIQSDKTQFSLAGKPAGIYIVEIKNHRYSMTQKFTLKK